MPSIIQRKGNSNFSHGALRIDVLPIDVQEVIGLHPKHPTDYQV